MRKKRKEEHTEEGHPLKVHPEDRGLFSFLKEFVNQPMDNLSREAKIGRLSNKPSIFMQETQIIT